MKEMLKYYFDAFIVFVQNMTWRKLFIILIASYLVIQLILIFPKMLLITILFFILLKLIIGNKN